MRPAAGEGEGDTPVDAALIFTKMLVSERNKDNGEEREGEDKARRYVPLLEDYAGVLYLGIPAAGNHTYNGQRPNAPNSPEHVH